MNAQLLIEENNRKRELLTEENEKYYDKLLVYIRLKLMLSEQLTEEVLMEMLDHLLEAQEHGKTAQDIFGDDPKAYADEIIEQIPKEKKRKLVPFVGGIVLNIVSWLLIIRAVVYLVISQFKEVDSAVYPVSVLVLGLVIACTVIITCIFLLKKVESSIFKENQTPKKDMLIVGTVSALGMAIVLLMTKFLPSIGPSFEFSWWASLLIGGVLVLVKYVNKRRG